MPDFERGDVVRVPFPYTDRNTRQHRPALVVSNGPLGESDRLLWVVMITSAENRRWAEDVPLDEDYAAAGLPAPSLIRPVKIATIDAAVAKKLGRIDPDRLARAMQSVRAKL
ncbi:MULTISPECIES: type II toxin-antitoxin system PemK/MazF family toxin [Brevundimonas]|jgi:mRNA interferase MazF|uniref:type II toxin-antitoxin system PemK/MazF family toxin n=1 Tax=Brevundimonas TaxID=41275 RepID=UPI00128F0C09|nr:MULTISPECIES: type II toxin-antitoxin system PemK/MazF family toxin [Brevundimonas]MBB1179176.1 type II toxin-antitoxin system PemK/MazF family toxin [Pseudomonas sp. FW305-3-2-15-E-TSA4]MCC4294690.1 type II toxin-antitoxin system PemK/MazF family toxin [Brevundimonas aurantiaca]QFU33117.1 PemK-like protein [Brevundimonas sp. Bb-A]